MLKVRRGNTLAGIYEMVYPIILPSIRYSFLLYFFTIIPSYISSPIAQSCTTEDSKPYFVGSSLKCVDLFLSSQKSALVKDGCFVMYINTIFVAS